jgi:hypothetical protein
MSDRERWVVYPLLFLALGAALRDKLFDRTTTRSIVCQELTVVGEEPTGGQPMGVIARIGRAESLPGGSTSGYLIVNGQVNVNGLVNAKQYAYQGVPFVPALQAIFPWSADFMRMLRPADPSPRRQPDSADGDPSPPTTTDDGPPSDPAPAESDSQPAAPTDNSDDQPAEPALADPPENR